MKGKHQGVERRVLDINREELCICYVLAIVLILLFVIWQILVVKLKCFFGTVQHIYVLFSGSSKEMESVA